jgi:hypothetical protein
MPEILTSFKILFKPEDVLFMYAKLDDGSYTRTYDTPLGVESVYIDEQEYASALASLLLRE